MRNLSTVIRNLTLTFLMLSMIFGVLHTVEAQETDQEMPVGAVGGAVHADPFTGTATTSIPIQVPPGRQGIQPDLALVYGSSNGNGWLGMGWKLEKGVIERQTKMGVDYNGDDYVFRLSGINVELVNIGNDEYRAKVEGGFTRVQKLADSSDGKPYFKATDKTGKTFIFGSVSTTRVADPNDATKIFRWCLERVEDVHGNYMTLSYTPDKGQAYLIQIDYTGHGNTTPTNQIIFHLEDRSDAPPMYVPNFEMTTAKRLKTIEIKAGSNVVRAYELTYTIAPHTFRSILNSIQQYGMNVTIDSSGTITNSTGLPPLEVQFEQGAASLTEESWGIIGPRYDHELVPIRNVYADFNGDGKTDWLYHHPTDNSQRMYVSTGNSFVEANWGIIGPRYDHELVPIRNVYADFNGDGKTDWLYHHPTDNSQRMYVSTGNSFVEANWGIIGPRLDSELVAIRNVYRDFNGDGKTDWLYHHPTDNSQRMYVSTGNSFVEENWGIIGPRLDSELVAIRNVYADFNGDGKTDWLYHHPTDNSQRMYLDPSPFSDLVKVITNGIGGSTTIEYTPSTEYANTQLPFPIQTVSKITTDDGNGNVSGTTYEYEGGFHHIGERDFRGFNYVKVTGQAGPSGEQTITETWFHQGNDTAVDLNDPDVADGYLKGAPYRVKVTDGQGNLYSETTTTYTADDNGQAPFFSPPASVVTDICDGTACSKQTRTDFTYDSNGNVTREDQHGDTGTTSDDRTVVRTYDPNTTDWILGLPTSETIYEGLGTGTQLAQTSFYYDGTTSCSAPSTNQQPTKGQLTRVVKWLSTGIDPESRMAYDSHGNVTCTRDAKGNTTTMAYEPSGTFAISATNALGHTTTTQYYGVNGVAMDLGLYGQVKSVTSPNGAIVTSEYDALGRRIKVTQPDGFFTTTSYINFGTVGNQHVRTDATVNGTTFSTWTYFDGLGRTMTTKSTGTDSKIIVSNTEYDLRGAVTRTSVPVFEPATPTQWTQNLYDPMGRIIQTTNPDGTRGLACFDDWTTVTIDANNHRKRTTRDAYGRVATVQEYTGTYTSCDASEGTPYSTTTYSYDDLGNLLTLTDTLGNQSSMNYDSLSRKTSMQDPDMGTWTYTYDVNGNLTQQSDAKGQQIHFQYDALNRRVQKDFDTAKNLGSGDVIYTYDGSAHHRIGRLQEVQDSIGTTTFFYDIMGRVTKTNKIVDSTTYTTQSAYDNLGRVTALTYPDNSTVTQTYNGPQLEQVKEDSTIYASYGGFNALGQPSTLTLGNGVTTTYTYDAQNFRLKTLKTEKGSTVLQDLGYSFDAGGNVTQLTDATHGNQTFDYDDLDRLTSATGSYPTITYAYNAIGNMTSNSQLGTYSYPDSGSARPHTVTSAGGKTYNYDANGNMISGAGRTIAYDHENRPISITTSGDGSGGGGSGGGSSVEEWELEVGTRVGDNDLYDSGVLSSATLTDTVSNLPSNGHPVYVRLKSKVSGTWSSVDYIYTATGSSAGQQLTSPPIGSVLTSTLPTFTWNPNGVTPDHWYIEIKEEGQSSNLYDSGNIASGATSHTVTQVLPTDGRNLIVRLWSEINGSWNANDFPYISLGGASGGGGTGQMNSPAPSSTLSGNSVTFSWTDPNAGGGGGSGGGLKVDEWELEVGTRAGDNDLYDSGVLGSGTLTDTVSNLPSNGHPVYVRLKSKLNGTWSSVDYTYTATGSSAGQQLTSPPIGSVLTSTLPTFTWNPNGVTPDYWYIEIKEEGQSSNLYDSGNIASGATSHTVTQALPTDGRNLIVRLWSEINGSWNANDFPYISLGGASGRGGTGQMNSPAPSSTLSGNSVTFSWTDPNAGGGGGSGGGGSTTTTTTFAYDGDGGRVKKTVDDGSLITWTTYIGKLYVCEGTALPLSCAKMIFSGSQRIAIKQVDDGSTSYFHPDHLGSTSVLTDSNGVSEQDVAYYPYGDTRSNAGTADVPYKYTGKEQDSSTGLYFYEARYYDPVLGRFISADTIVPSITDAQSLNRYSYARNNPILYNDPSGHFFKKAYKGVKQSFKSVEKFTFENRKYLTGAQSIYVDWALTNRTIGPYVRIAGAAAASYWGGPWGAAGFAAYTTRLDGGSAGDAVKAGAITYATARAFEGVDAYTGDNDFAGIVGHGIVGGTSAELQGGKFQNGFITAASARTLRAGWEWARDYTNASAVDGGNQTNCGAILGICTDQGRQLKIDGKILSCESNCEYQFGSPNLRGDHFYNGTPILDNFVVAFSKVHDWMVSFRYDGGYYVPYGNTAAESAFQLYNIPTMVPAAAYTAAAFTTSGNPITVDISKRF